MRQDQHINKSEEKKDIAETLQKMLHESDSQTSEVTRSNLPSTDGTSDKGQGGGALLTAPSVLISKKNKNTNARRTAPT